MIGWLCAIILNGSLQWTWAVHSLCTTPSCVLRLIDVPCMQKDKNFVRLFERGRLVRMVEDPQAT